MDLQISIFILSALPILYVLWILMLQCRSPVEFEASDTKTFASKYDSSVKISNEKHLLINI